MKHLRRFNESNLSKTGWGSSGISPEYQKYWDEYKKNNARIEAEHEEKRKQEREKWLEENPDHKGLTRKESIEKLERDRKESDPYSPFRIAIKLASKGDVNAHQKMIDLLDKHGVDLIKWRRYINLKMAAELGKEEVMDVLFDALEKAGEDTTELKKGLEEYVRNSRG